MNVAVMKPPLARKTGNAHASFVLVFKLLAPRFKWIYGAMLKADRSAVVAIILTFQAEDLCDTPVIRFLSMLSSVINSSIRVSMM